MWELLFELLGAAAIIIWVAFFLHVRLKSGTLLVDDQTYSYSLGDDVIRSGRGRFRGMAIILPKRLPHMYLDGHSADGIRGPRYVMAAHQRLELEGDFNTHFQLYAVDQFKSLALSIITPDVMQALVDTAGKYDIEVYGNQLRIITLSKVYDQPARETELIKVAEVLLLEIGHRLKSWNEQRETSAITTLLEAEDSETIKLGKRAFNSSQWGLFITFFGVAALLWVLGGLMQATKSEAATDITSAIRWVFGMGFAVFPVGYLVAIIIYRTKKF